MHKQNRPDDINCHPGGALVVAGAAYCAKKLSSFQRGVSGAFATALIIS